LWVFFEVLAMLLQEHYWSGDRPIVPPEAMTMKTLALAATISLLSLIPIRLVPVAMAQVSSDGTLSTTVNRGGNDFVIEGGDRAGNNLFHSFREFSVPTGGSAYFNNATDIHNIFSRVTGGNLSNIDGLLRANGRANLFLLNPNGIIFGSNAQLHIGGSFIGSTANRLRFTDGAIFDTSTSAAPILTVSVPAGLQLANSGNSGNIQVNGLGNQEIVPTTNFGLAIAPGQTLALVGRAVTFDGGIATAAAGRLEVGGVAQGEVTLTPNPVGWQLDYGKVERFGDVRLLNRSSLWNPLSSAVGGIQVQGDRILLNNSQIAAVAGGNPAAEDFPGGNIVVNAATALELGGTNAIYPFSSWITNQVAPSAPNAGGLIQLTAPQLRIQDGARVQTLSQGSGRAGNIQVNSDAILIRGAAAADPTLQDLFNSRITSDAIATGNGGEVRIIAQRITLRNGGQIGTLVAPQATGHGGNVFVNSSEMIARGMNPFNPNTSSGLVSTTVGAGDGGSLRMVGDRVTLLDGGFIQTQTLGTGRGGDITVRASNSITARRISPVLQGGIASYTFGAANSGNVTLATDHLRLYEGANISTVSLSSTPGVSILGVAVPNGGNAGAVRINARQSIEIAEVNPSLFIPGAITTTTVTSGNAGDIDVSTRRLAVRQGGAIASGVLFSLAQARFTGVGTGNGGDIRINASESIFLEGLDLKTRLNSTVNTYTIARGNAGDLRLQTPRLTLQDGGTLGTVNAAVGQAGRVTINADRILVSGTAATGRPAEIFATVRIAEPSIRRAFNIPAVPTGRSGRLTLNADRITVANGGRINVQHQGIGNAGQLSLNTNSLMLENQGRIIAATASGEGGNIRLNARERVVLRDRSQISTTANGDGNGGNISINSPFLIGLTNSDIIAQAQAGRGGNISINAVNILGITPRLSLTSGSDINASSQLGLNGTVNLTNPSIKPESGLVVLPEEVVDSSQQIGQTCGANQNNQFVATGRGGIPENPSQSMNYAAPWSDLRDLNLSESHQTVHRSTSTPTEATALQVNGYGQLELVAEGTAPWSNYKETCAGHER
jgi:filamentous hemagglutinin family protein